MAEGYISNDVVVGVYESLVNILISGQFSAAAWACEALSQLPPLNKQQIKANLVKLLKEKTAHETDEITLQFIRQVQEAYEPGFEFFRNRS